jgi:uncharacterized protein (DUF4415 family)
MVNAFETDGFSMTIDRKRTRAEKAAYAELDKLLLIEMERTQLYRHAERMLSLPGGWDGLEKSSPVRPRKTSLTLRLDADMVKWFRALGQGYQARMNAVLRTYMLALVSKAIESRGSTDWKGEPI